MAKDDLGAFRFLGDLHDPVAFLRSPVALLFDDLVLIWVAGRDDDLCGLDDTLAGGIEKLGVAADEGLLRCIGEKKALQPPAARRRRDIGFSPTEIDQVAARYFLE